MSDEAWRVQAMIQLTDVESECVHGHLPADRNVSCGCWTDARTDALLGQVPLGWEDHEFDPGEALRPALRVVRQVPELRLCERCSGPIPLRRPSGRLRPDYEKARFCGRACAELSQRGVSERIGFPRIVKKVAA